MSYILKHLPELQVLKKQIKDNPEVIKYYSKYGAFIGSENSIKWITKKIKNNT